MGPIPLSPYKAKDGFVNFLPPPEKSRVHWIQMLFLVISPFVGVIGALCLKEWRMETIVWAVVYYFITGLGITAGYHRLWAHKSYEANVAYQVFMMLAGSGAAEGSIHWWSRGHRAHHRYTDTNRDPYNAHRGMFWSHIGWMFFKPDRGVIGSVDMSDLEKNPIVAFQHKHYIYFVLFMAFVFPTLVSGIFWGDWLGGYFIAGILRMVFVQHATFCVNSLAHYLGEAPFDDKRTPRDHFVTALITLGEGYHNFHHEFPNGTKKI